MDPSKGAQYVLRNPNKLVLDNISYLSEHRVSGFSLCLRKTLNFVTDLEIE